jgi:murein L,D-transpeptidase YafK
MKNILPIVIFLAFYATSVQADINLVKVDKSARKMYLLDHGHVVKVFHIALGANPKGPKRQEGDEKTPEGIYYLDYKKEDSSFYRAMHINYPNEQDEENAKNRGVSPGGFIMVHGQKNWPGKPASFTRRFDWTEGCIALSNHEMDEFMSLVKVGTEILIEW